nr:hypothetical protein [uncultured Bacteroides sp.]
MNLAYYADFKSRNSTPYRVEIYTKESVSEAKELLLSSTPFTVEWESDSLFKPLKMSNAVCSILSDKPLLNLYTGDAQGVKIYLINSIRNLPEWVGYVTPNLYSSDYISLDTIDIEAVDTIACLDFIKYSYIGDRAEFRSFYEIIMYLINKADPKKSIDTLLVQESNKLSFTDTTCILENLYINERNFFDEAGEPMTCKDVLSSLVEYLGMTIFQWQNYYYIVDYNCIKNSHNQFFKYHRAVESLSGKIHLDLEIKNITDIGVASSNGAISLDNVYNKVTVTANTNPVDDLLPELFDDEDLKNQNSDPNKYYNETIDNTVFLSAYFKSESNWITAPMTALNAINIGEVTGDNVKDIISGAFFQKNDSYGTDSPEPSSLSWEKHLTFVKKKLGFDVNIGGRHTDYLSLNKKDNILLKGGYLIIDFSFKLSQSYIADDGYKSPNSKAVYVNTENNKYSAGYDDTMFYCKLKIGDYYYDGENWRPYSEYLNNISYYKQYIGSETVYGEKKYYKKDSAGNKTYIDKAEYDKIYAEDRFLIVRKNNENDKIYDTWRNPTNQVSYKLDLSNASDGVLIKLPDFCLYGEVEFDLCQPTILGGIPCYLTDGNGSGYCNYCHLKDFSMIYTNKKYVYDVFGNAIDNSEDIVYDNVINENYEIEADEVKLLVNTYQNNILSYSNVATKNDGKLDYLKSIYNNEGNYLPERILIDKLYEHYKAPKFIYSNTLNYEFSPFDRIKENSLNKIFVVRSLGIDYANDSVDVTLIEP